MNQPVYITREGRQFGLEDRVRIARGSEVIHEVTPASIVTFPVLRARVWGLLHGYGWLRVGAA